MATSARVRAWPDAAIPPGELLEEELAARGMTQHDLALRTGRPVQVINAIVRGKKQITHQTALELETVLGIPAHFWASLESNYQLIKARLRESDELTSQETELKGFPVGEMERRGWIPRRTDAREKVREVLRFLGVASFDAWRQSLAGLRVTPGSPVSSGTLAVWLRKGELEGMEVETAPYDRDRFLGAVRGMRGLTTEPPQVFVPRVKALGARAGVAIVVVPELPRSGANGAARWLTPSKALIQLSLRYKTNDQLWFSLFHEAGHILHHKSRVVHVDGIDGDGEAESEADAFARDLMIPPHTWADFVATNPRSRVTVEGFSREIGIAPGIVVGRLQREGLIPCASLNDLKFRLRWGKASDE